MELEESTYLTSGSTTKPQLSSAFCICRCIRQALKEKITILVTHQLQYLEDASQILILKDVSGF